MILLLVDKNTKVYFNCIVSLFCLPVCLKVEHGEESFLNTKELIEQGPELRRKNCSVVTDNRV